MGYGVKNDVTLKYSTLKLWIIKWNKIIKYIKGINDYIDILNVWNSITINFNKINHNLCSQTGEGFKPHSFYSHRNSPLADVLLE